MILPKFYYLSKLILKKSPYFPQHLHHSFNSEIFYHFFDMKIIFLYMALRWLSFTNISHSSNSARSKLRTASPPVTEAPLYQTSQGTERLKQFACYLKNYVKKKNQSFSPIVTLRKPRISSQDLSKKQNHFKSRKASCTGNQNKIKPIKRARPARFLTQKDIENHLGLRERPQKILQNKEDMKILVENNFSQQLKSFEVDKICRLYNTGFKKSNLAKKDDWKWHSPDRSPRNVTFQDTL